MKHGRRWLLWALAVVFSIISTFDLLIPGEDSVWAGEILNSLNFGSVDLGFQYFVDFLQGMIPLVMFQIVMGLAIYEHYCVASVYFFSRCSRIRMWFVKEAGKLFGEACAYSAVVMCSAILVCFAQGRLQMGGRDFPELFWRFLLYALWLFATSLLINLLAIRFDSVAGFGAVFGAEVLLVTALGALEGLNLSEPQEISGYGIQYQLWKWNPITQLVGKWHSGELQCFQGMEIQLVLPNVFSLGYFLAFGILVTAYGFYVISKTEFIENQKEG